VVCRAASAVLPPPNAASPALCPRPDDGVTVAPGLEPIAAIQSRRQRRGPPRPCPVRRRVAGAGTVFRPVRAVVAAARAVPLRSRRSPARAACGRCGTRRLARGRAPAGGGGRGDVAVGVGGGAGGGGPHE